MNQEILADNTFAKKMDELLENLLSGKYQALGISDPQHIEAIEEVMQGYPLKLVSWDRDIAHHSLVQTGQNEYLLRTSLVAEKPDGKQCASEIYVQINVSLTPLRLSLLSVSY